MKKFLTATICAGLLSPLAGWAGGVNDMPSVRYDNIAAKLIMSGYRDVRVVDPEMGRMSAYDRDGSEVIVRVDQVTREILSTTHVHVADQ